MLASLTEGPLAVGRAPRAPALSAASRCNGSGLSSAGPQPGYPPSAPYGCGCAPGPTLFNIGPEIVERQIPLVIRAV